MDHPYARALADEITAREAEVAGIAVGSFHVDADGALAHEILTLIRESGGATVERIARERGVPHAVSHAVVLALSRFGLVVLRQTSRGAVMAQIAGSSSR